MSVDDEVSKNAAETTVATAEEPEDGERERLRQEKILKAKELYSKGSRNYLVKSYSEAADQLSEVCALYDELYGEGCAELGMPYLLYAKSLIALAVDENKVLDVPDEVDEDDDEDDEDEEEEETESTAKAVGNADEAEAAADEKLTKTTANAAAEAKTNGAVKKSTNEADSTAKDANQTIEKSADKKPIDEPTAKAAEDAQVSSSSSSGSNNVEKPKNGTAIATAEATSSTSKIAATPFIDGEKPSTSNGEVAETDNCADDEDDEETEAISNLRLAWEILELAAKIFSRQGLSGLPNLAEVQTELANIEFENNIMDAAREDYEKALKIYQELPKSYHRAMAEIHYKIGLTYLMQQMNKEGAASLKEACDLIDAEIADIKAKAELTEKDKNNIQDMEETKQEIRAKIDEIEETQAQNIAEVRAALDSYIKPIVSQNAEGAGTSSSSASAAAAPAAAAAATSTAAAGSTSNITSSSPTSSSSSTSSKPTDISHLIKRKKPEEPNSEAEASPAKRPAV